jgi:hypothetical protein
VRDSILLIGHYALFIPALENHLNLFFGSPMQQNSGFKFQVSDFVSFPLRRIHAGLLGLIEDNQSQEQDCDA